MKSQALRVIFRTPGRVDVEPPSVADSLRECAMASPWAWQGVVDAVVNDIEDEVVDFFSSLSEQLFDELLESFADLLSSVRKNHRRR
jgi:hypothetical protein